MEEVAQLQRQKEKQKEAELTPVFAEGLISLLQPVVIECDVRIQAVMTSQSDLSKQLDHVSAQLDKFMELSKLPSLEGYVDKLQQSRMRMVRINTTLSQIQQRLLRLQKEHSMVDPFDKQGSKPQSEGRFSSWFKSILEDSPQKRRPSSDRRSPSSEGPPNTAEPNSNPNPTPPTTKQPEELPEEQQKESSDESAEEKKKEVEGGDEKDEKTEQPQTET
eukprot:CAMPEP_0174255626 /NCGR_PEP_ID=MMETSP0439-20130205/4942_1 /TAXON_ID=0 /ORGANISM="Stereomyxa ramosa, Strain Chinc5" /LENGTH=218 /DNA_ID=CAMNT_0015337879 /DNA_START=13 /DNA_END=669 /DNA_ORIENTATION=+